METLFESHTLTAWLLQYGSITLFVLLMLGIVAFPVPEETLLVITGILLRHGKLHVVPTLLASYFGAICGITISYFLGRTAGHFLLIKYGSWFGATPARIEKVHNWFERFGKWTLSFGYFIPGVRHFTGFIAGTSELSYRPFAIFAYTGAFFWVSLFLSIGFFFDEKWLNHFAEYAHVEWGLDIISLILISLFVALAAYLAYKIRRR